MHPLDPNNDTYIGVESKAVRLSSPSGVQNKTLVHSYFSGVNSLADTYQRAAGFGVTGAHSILLGCIIWAIPNRGHTHLERIFLLGDESRGTHHDQPHELKRTQHAPQGHGVFFSVKWLKDKT